MAAIYAASQSTLSTGLNSVATSWTLDIQERLSKKDMSFALQTKIAQYVSLGVGIVAILVSMVLANGEIKSAYESVSYTHLDVYKRQVQESPGSRGKLYTGV